MAVQRGAVLALAAVALATLTACGPGEPSVMPDVVGERLDVAESDIEAAGYRGDVEIVGGGLFGVIDRSNWVVCEQRPGAGETVVEPRLVVDRECEVSEDGPDSAPSPAPTAAGPEVPVVDTTPDELLTRMNSAGYDGIRVGDRFRFTGELAGEEYWVDSVGGDYTVYFAALGGTNDLSVFVDHADAAGWSNGTILEVVVEHVELKVGVESADGFLRMISWTER